VSLRQRGQLIPAPTHRAPACSCFGSPVRQLGLGANLQVPAFPLNLITVGPAMGPRWALLLLSVAAVAAAHVAPARGHSSITQPSPNSVHGNCKVGKGIDGYDHYWYVEALVTLINVLAQLVKHKPTVRENSPTMVIAV